MAKYLLKRIFYMILTLFLVATITFFLMKMMPGSPYANEAKMTATQKAIMNKQYGLDKPVIEHTSLTWLALRMVTLGFPSNTATSLFPA